MKSIKIDCEVLGRLHKMLSGPNGDPIIVEIIDGGNFAAGNIRVYATWLDRNGFGIDFNVLASVEKLQHMSRHKLEWGYVFEMFKDEYIKQNTPFHPGDVVTVTYPEASLGEGVIHNVGYSLAAPNGFFYHVDIDFTGLRWVYDSKYLQMLPDAKPPKTVNDSEPDKGESC